MLLGKLRTRPLTEKSADLIMRLTRVASDLEQNFESNARTELLIELMELNRLVLELDST